MSPSPRDPSSPQAVVFWLTANDRTRFVSGDRADQLIGDCGGRIVDPAAAGRGVEQMLHAEVVVTGWNTPPIPELLLKDPDCRLRYVCHLAGSVRRLIPRYFLEKGGLVTNWGDAAAVAVAEHALLLALAALREAGHWRDAMGGSWKISTKTLFGKRIGIHGMGRIAQHLIRMLAPFGVSICAYSAGVPDHVFRELRVDRADSLAELFRASEVLFECEALNDHTEGIVTAQLLAELPNDAVFVNVGRGRVVDESALISLAQSNRLRVAVDVMAREPVTLDSALARIPGVIVSPHIGGPVTEDYPKLGQLALANVRRYRAGLPLENVIDLAAYDRST